MTTVGVINYGVGNLRSVHNALNHVGAKPVISEDASTLMNCDRIIFPGVGAFAYGMAELVKRGLHEVVHSACEKGKPLLAICVGMQLLFDRSSEFGNHEGLGIVSGDVEQFPKNANQESTLRLPNVGWLPVSRKAASGGISETVLKDVDETSRFYFIHSFHAPAHTPNTAATASYAGHDFTAIVARDNLIGTQFHPEKSGSDGLRLLANFVR